MIDFFVFMSCVIGFCVIVFSIIYWSDHSNLETPKIKFASFKKFYEINPKRWQLHHGMVYCRIDTCAYEKFHFSYFDFYRYRSWFNKLCKAQQQTKHNKSLKRMMDVVKQDIAEAEAKAKAMQNKALDDLVKWANENTTNDLLNLQSLVEEYKKIYENNH